MPFSHHSHSGQFCRHAQDKLEDVLRTAVAKKMSVYALTEHMPRRDEDLYPEEIEQGDTASTLTDLFAAYYAEAMRLRDLYADRIHLLVGTEIDWIRPSSKDDIFNLLSKYKLDLFIGSVHHVHSIPIDYDRQMYVEAMRRSSNSNDDTGSEERLFQDYFDLQYDMLRALKPPIVGHFDLIRLKSDQPDAGMSRWPDVWRRVLRNLDLVAEYGGLLEINSAGLRKGLKEPYPQAEICKEFMKKNGHFTLSDDSHGVGQVATHYQELFAFLEANQIQNMAYLERTPPGTPDSSLRLHGLSIQHVQLEHLKKSPFFD